MTEAPTLTFDQFSAWRQRTNAAIAAKANNPRKAVNTQIDAALPGIVDQLIAQAEGGCLKSQSLLLNKRISSLKPVDDPLPAIYIDTSQPAESQITATVDLLLSGTITLEQATALTNILTQLQKSRDDSELMADVARMVASYNSKKNKSRGFK